MAVRDGDDDDDNDHHHHHHLGCDAVKISKQIPKLPRNTSAQFLSLNISEKHAVSTFSQQMETACLSETSVSTY